MAKSKTPVKPKKPVKPVSNFPTGPRPVAPKGPDTSWYTNQQGPGMGGSVPIGPAFPTGARPVAPQGADASWYAGQAGPGMGALPASWVQDPVTGQWHNTAADANDPVAHGNDPKFDFNAPDSTSAMGDDQRRAALQAIVGLNGVGGSAFAGENTTASDYGLGFTRYAADVTDPNDPTRVIHRAGEVNFDTGFSAPDSFQSGDTVGGFGNTDPNNPFSRASMLHKSYAAANDVSSGSFANRGQLSSGAYQRQQGRNTFGYEQGKDALLKGFASRLNEFQAQRQGAYNADDTSRLQNSNDLFGRNTTRYNAQYPSS